MPIEPPPTSWALPPAEAAGDDDIVAAGGDLSPGMLLAAYRSGIFPMPVEDHDAMLWWSPACRGILDLDDLVVSRSLRQSCRKLEVTVDRDFAAVIHACADPGREGGWIDAQITDAYLGLHRLGWAHSVEAWDAAGNLAGGLYGLAIGGLFAGESMFHTAPDASKVALMGLVELLSADRLGERLLDVQWATPHLESLGCVEVPRRRYLTMLERALALPLPVAFDDRS
ncbi:MAG TPA: leucyl/phenylalanyl-tRNA--protein transferase, partial [Nocardioidaceae bacterium]|nr:leucyl/phenylalanyl-tRNA--protein transferase [Nocardioidaceae bacterium]